MVCDLSIFLNTFTCAIDFPCKDDKISPHHFRGRPRIQVFLWVTNLSEQESWNKDLWSMWTILEERWDCSVFFLGAPKSHRLYLLETFRVQYRSRVHRIITIETIRCDRTFATKYSYTGTSYRFSVLYWKQNNTNLIDPLKRMYRSRLELFSFHSSRPVKYRAIWAFISSHNALAQKRVAFVRISPKMGVLLSKQSRSVLVVLWEKRPSVGCDVWIGIVLRKRPQYPLVHCHEQNSKNCFVPFVLIEGFIPVGIFVAQYSYYPVNRNDRSRRIVARYAVFQCGPTMSFTT